MLLYLEIDKKTESFELPLEIVDTTEEGSEDRPVIIAKNEGIKSFSSFPIEIPKFQYIQPPEILVLKGIGEIGGAASAVTTLASFGFSGHNGITTVKLFQLIDFLIFINIDLPDVTYTFINKFEGNPLDLVPNYLDNGDPECEIP